MQHAPFLYRSAGPDNMHARMEGSQVSDESITRMLAGYSLDDFPAALGGCRNQGTAHDCCEYDLSVFDERSEPDTILDCGAGLATIHHCSLGETRSGVLTQFADMRIIHDEGGILWTMLAKIQSRKGQIYRDHMRNCLIDSLFCISRSREGSSGRDPLASCWLKCAAFYLADSLVLYHSQRPSPSHSLQIMRTLPDDRMSRNLSTVNACIGTERATTVLLRRMLESAVGLSDMVEGNDRSRIMRTKYNYLVENMLLSDCYFYLGYATKNIMVELGNNITHKPELVHLLPMALDVSADLAAADRDADLLYGTAHQMLSLV